MQPGWLNHVLRQWWMVQEPALARMLVKNNIEPLLANVGASQPSVDSIVLDSLTLGPDAPQIQSLRVEPPPPADSAYARALRARGVSEVTLHVELRCAWLGFRLALTAALAILGGHIAVPVSVARLVLDAELKVVLRFGRDGALRLVTYNVWFDGRNQASRGP